MLLAFQLFSYTNCAGSSEFLIPPDILLFDLSASVHICGCIVCQLIQRNALCKRHAKKFDHNEWTGYNGAEDVFAVNREPAAPTIIPYQSTKAAADAVWDYNAREASSFFQKLTGENELWELTVVQNADQAAPLLAAGAMNPGYAAGDGWKNVTLPKSWTCDGFDHSLYTNCYMPWQHPYDTNVDAPHCAVNYNPVGLYRKSFTVPDEMLADNRRIELQFDGVESAYYVYVNGREVGYSEDSYSPHRFDITDAADHTAVELWVDPNAEPAAADLQAACLRR